MKKKLEQALYRIKNDYNKKHEELKKSLLIDLYEEYPNLNRKVK